MGAEQTLTSRNSQENVTSNNALSINDFSSHGLSLQRKASVANNTGLPDSLKSGVESLSGYSLDDVRVHYNSSKPAAVQAYAYTQGTDIHIAPGQERCLPHEAWHVTQQMSGRVSPTTSIGGVAVNDDASLEHEADVMGARASTLQGNSYAPVSRKAWSGSSVRQNKMTSAIVQRESEKSNGSVELVNDKTAIETFTKKDSYEKKDYRSGNLGRFNANYSPSKNELSVSLPVHYDNNMSELNKGGKAKKDFFKDNVEKTWSRQHPIGFRNTRINEGVQTLAGETWESALKDINVQVNVEEKSTAGNDVYFNLKSVAGGSSVSSVPGSDTRNVEMRNSALEETGWFRSDDNHPTLNASGHEAGHMFGLGDEYRITNTATTAAGVKYEHVYWTRTLKAFEKSSGQVKEHPLNPGSTITHDGVDYLVHSGIDKDGWNFYYLSNSGVILDRALDGTVSTHYDLVKDYISEDYANKHAVMHDNRVSSHWLLGGVEKILDNFDCGWVLDPFRKGTAIMLDGDTVEKQHYVTFADAMVDAIQETYRDVPSSNAPNAREDWTIK